jgi:3-deoxy-7-phosphoheptulonate synthase
MENSLCDHDLKAPDTNAYPLSGRHNNPGGTILEICGREIGGRDIMIMAGPCAVENFRQLKMTAEGVRDGGAGFLRGGAFKPRTSPYSFQGLGAEGLKMLKEVSQITGLPIITEVMDTTQIELVSEHADILQVGSRNMDNYLMLKEIGNCRKPVLIKRGMSATINEFILAAEYVMKGGNNQVMLCERGIRTFETATRNTLDLNAVPVLKRYTHLPVIVDPSHGTGYAWMVPDMARAAVAVGADGLLMEVHVQPAEALCDGGQSLDVHAFRELMDDLEKVALAVGRRLFKHESSTV